MGKIAGILLLVMLVAVVGGGIYLATSDIPAPAAKVEKVIPDERLPR